MQGIANIKNLSRNQDIHWEVNYPKILNIFKKYYNKQQLLQAYNIGTYKYV